MYLDHVRIRAAIFASSPSPEHYARRIAPWVQLAWDAPEVAGAEYELYFGTNPDITANPKYTGVSETFDPGVLNYLTDYYWRMDTIADGVTHAGDVWTFATGGAATDPLPADGALNQPISDGATLAWTPDSWATSFKVYAGRFGTLDYLGEVTEPVFSGYPTPFELAAYQWRVDEYVNGMLTVPGDIWEFTTRQRLIGCPVGDINGDCR